jgi:hypothetical protein
MQQREPSSIFYLIGKKLGWWFAANRHRLIQGLIYGILRRIPGGSLLLRIFR